METKYLLVQWPESQSFIGVKGCYFASIDEDEDDDLTLDQAMFVPEDLYCEVTGFVHQFGRTVKNEELQDILSQYPKDADVAVEYCDVKNLKYFPDRNFIAID